MEKYRSLISPSLVLAVTRKNTLEKEEALEDKSDVNSALLLSCLDKAGQSSIFFKHSFHENLQYILEEKENDCKIKMIVK